MSVVDILPVNRAERRRQHTYDALKMAAALVMNEVGYHRLTIKAITERADLGYGTFYLHFADKDAIVWAVLHDLAEQLHTAVDAQLAEVPFPRREYLSWVAIFEYIDTTREGFVQVFGSRGSANLLQRYQHYLADLHERNLRAGNYTADLDLPPEFLAQFMTGALVRLLVWWCETPNSYTPRQMAAMVYQTIYRHPPPTEWNV